MVPQLQQLICYMVEPGDSSKRNFGPLILAYCISVTSLQAVALNYVKTAWAKEIRMFYLEVSWYSFLPFSKKRPVSCPHGFTEVWPHPLMCDVWSSNGPSATLTFLRLGRGTAPNITWAIWDESVRESCVSPAVPLTCTTGWGWGHLTGRKLNPGKGKMEEFLSSLTTYLTAHRVTTVTVLHFLLNTNSFTELNQ